LQWLPRATSFLWSLDPETNIQRSWVSGSGSMLLDPGSRTQDPGSLFKGPAPRIHMQIHIQKDRNIYIYIYIYICIHIHTYKNIYVHRYTYICTHILGPGSWIVASEISILSVSGSLVSVSRVPPGCSLLSGRFLGGSWLHPGCIQMIPECPGKSRCI
jgi:hypothetical protein